MTGDQIFLLLLAVTGMAMVIGGPLIIMRRAARIQAAQDAEARAFEQELLMKGPAATAGPASGTSAATPAVAYSTGGSASPGGLAGGSNAASITGVNPAGMSGAAGFRTVGRAMPAFGEPSVHESAHPLPVAASATPAVPPVPGVGPVSLEGRGVFVQSIIDKLEAGRTFKSVEGPLRSANPALVGTLVSLHNGKRIGIVETGFDRDDPSVRALLRHMDGLIVEGDGGEALLIRRFQDFLSDMISL